MDMREAIDLSEGALGTKMLKTFTIINAMVDSGAIGGYALCGAMAAYEYIEVGYTRDIDLTVELPGFGLITNFKSITDFLESHNLPVAWDDEGIVIGSYPVQFIPPASALDHDALRAAKTINSIGTPIRIWSVEHLMAKCLEIGRPKDYERLSRFLDETEFDMVSFCKYVQTFDLSAQWKGYLARTGRPDVCERTA